MSQKSWLKANILSCLAWYCVFVNKFSCGQRFGATELSVVAAYNVTNFSKSKSNSSVSVFAIDFMMSKKVINN